MAETTHSPPPLRRLWSMLIVVQVFSFAALLHYRGEIYQASRWARAIGDTIFGVGMLAMGWFVIGLSTGWSIRGEREDAPAPTGGTAEAH